MDALSIVPCRKPGIPKSLGSFHFQVLGSLLSGLAAKALPGSIAPTAKAIIRRGILPREKICIRRLFELRFPGSGKNAAQFGEIWCKARQFVDKHPWSPGA